MSGTGIKRGDIGPCLACRRGVMHDAQITFWRLSLERFVVDLNAVQRAHGLELVLGSPQLATVMGPDEDLAKRAGDADEGLVCDSCSATRTLFEIGEIISERIFAEDSVEAVKS